MVQPEGGLRPDEEHVKETYLIPAGRVIYQKTHMNREWPGTVETEFTAEKLQFSAHHRLSEFVATQQTTLYYRNKERYLYPGSHFFAYVKGLKKIK